MLQLYKRLSDASFGIKEADSAKGIVTGYLSAFNNIDSDRDIIRPGAFAKTIAENGPASKKPRIKHCQDHYRNMVVGVFQELKEDTYGLYYESKIGRDTKGRDYLLMCEDGIITEHSIGYAVMKSHWNTTEEATELLELKLYEGSGLQFWGANPETPITGIKSDSIKSAEDLTSLFLLLEKCLKTGKYTDETFVTLQKHYDAIGLALKSTGFNEVVYKGLTTVEKKEKKFLMDMIAHHTMALDMAGKVSESDRLKAFAQKLIKNQSAEIEQMTGWLKEWFDAAPGGMKSTEPPRGTQPDAKALAELITRSLKLN